MVLEEHEWSIWLEMFFVQLAYFNSPTPLFILFYVLICFYLFSWLSSVTFCIDGIFNTSGLLDKTKHKSIPLQWGEPGVEMIENTEEGKKKLFFWDVLVKQPPPQWDGKQEICKASIWTSTILEGRGGGTITVTFSLDYFFYANNCSCMFASGATFALWSV